MCVYTRIYKLTFLSNCIHEMKLYEENINKIRNGGYLYLGDAVLGERATLPEKSCVIVLAFVFFGGLMDTLRYQIINVLAIILFE